MADRIGYNDTVPGVEARPRTVIHEPPNDP